MTEAANAVGQDLGALLSRLRAVLEAQAEALSTDDFPRLESLSTERERLVQGLDPYGPGDLTPADRATLEQISALDQRLLELARSGLEQTVHGLRDVHRGRVALHEYSRRGQNLIQNLAALDREG